MNNFSNSFSRRNFSRAHPRWARCMQLEIRAAARTGPSAAQRSAHRKQPIADKGFASIRKIGNGVYATIADRSKGLQARCNGGFLIGRDAALMVEGFQTTIGS